MMRPKHVLAAVDETACADVVLRTAALLGAAMSLPATALYVTVGEDRAVRARAGEAGIRLRVVTGDPATRIAAAFCHPATIGVLGARAAPDDPRPAGGVAAAVITAVTAPVVVVGPRTQPPRHGALSRLVVPLDGTAQTADAVTPLVRRFAGRGPDVVLCHVFDRTTTPRFWDEPQHESRTWAEEFRTRWEHDAGGAPGAGVRCASGETAQEILTAVDAEDGDLLLVAWARDVSGERAAVVKALLAESRVPVVLLPRVGALPPNAHLPDQRRPVEHAMSSQV